MHPLYHQHDQKAGKPVLIGDSVCNPANPMQIFIVRGINVDGGLCVNEGNGQTFNIFVTTYCSQSLKPVISPCP